MSEPSLVLRHGPIDDQLPLERPDRTGQVGVSLRLSTPALLLQAATWADGVDAWQAALSQALSPVPARVGETCATAAGLLMRVGPEELWIVDEDSPHSPAERVAGLRAQLHAQIGSVLDLSHARVRLSVSGPRCMAMLSKLYALDFRDHAFPVGRVLLSGYHHVPCALHRTGQHAFDAYLFTTYARDQFETYVDAALEYGVRAA